MREENLDPQKKPGKKRNIFLIFADQGECSAGESEDKMYVGIWLKGEGTGMKCHSDEGGRAVSGGECGRRRKRSQGGRGGDLDIAEAKQERRGIKMAGERPTREHVRRVEYLQRAAGAEGRERVAEGPGGKEERR